MNVITVRMFYRKCLYNRNSEGIFINSPKVIKRDALWMMHHYALSTEQFSYPIMIFDSLQCKKELPVTNIRNSS